MLHPDGRHYVLRNTGTLTARDVKLNVSGDFAQAAFLQHLPDPPLTPDQVDMLKADNLVSAEAHAQRRTLEGLGIIPNSIEAIVPDYLWRFRKTGQFHGRTA